MSDLVFPTLIGETWPVIRQLIGGNTIVQTSANGLEVRIPLLVDRKFRWTVAFDWVSSDEMETTFQILFGFVARLNGMFDSFLYLDPDDNTAEDEIIGEGDGITKVFQLRRTMEGATDRIFGVNSTNRSPVVRVGGSSAGATVNKSGVVTFGSAPGSGQEITADFDYYWRVRLDTDDVEFENFAKTFWDVKNLKFISCRS